MKTTVCECIVVSIQKYEKKKYLLLFHGFLFLLSKNASIYWIITNELQCALFYVFLYENIFFSPKIWSYNTEHNQRKCVETYISELKAFLFMWKTKNAKLEI